MVFLPDKNQKNHSKFGNFVFVVWTCTTKWEKLLLLFGVISAVSTGLSHPYMSQTYGELSQVFVKITRGINNQTLDQADLEKAYSEFHNDMNRIVFQFAFIGTVSAVFVFLQCSLFKYVGNNTAYRVRRNYISRLLHKDSKYFDTVSTGYLSTVLNDNLERFREVFNEKLANIIWFTTDFVVGTILAFSTDWKLASCGSVFAIGIAFSGFINSAYIMMFTKQQNTHNANAGSIAFQALSSFKTVISLNGQKQEFENYSSELKAGEKCGTRTALFYATSRSVSHFFCNALNGIILYFGANLIYNKTLDQMVIVTLFHYMMSSAFSLAELLPHLSNLSTAITSATPIFELITSDDDDIENKNYKNQEDLKPIKGNISFKDVRFSYPTRPDTKVLKGVSFDIKNGECIALVGASGSGKSTIVQLLLHYYNIQSGGISIDGRDLSEIPLKKLRQSIGVVSQEPILFNTTIEENIRFGIPDATNFEIYEAMKNANAYEFVRSFPEGIKTVVGERGTQLSGGQKQRIAIARVLVRNPKTLLLDEATSALDNQNEKIVQAALKKASKGRTTIVIAHRLSTIKNCDKIMVMSQGQIVETGTHKELLKKGGVYQGLVHSQVFESEDMHKEHRRKAAEPVDFDSILKSSQKEKREEQIKETPEEENMKSSLWNIFNECRSDWLLLAIALFASAIQAVTYPLLAQLITRTYKAYSMEKEDILRYGHFWASMFGVFALVRPIALYCQFYFFGKVGEKLSTRLRFKSFQHLLSLPCAFYDDPKNSPIRLANRLNTDASNVRAAVDGKMGNVLTSILAMGIAISVAFYYTWQLTIQILLFFPILYFARVVYGRTTKTFVQRDSSAFEHDNRIVIEMFNSIKTVRSLNMEEKMMEISTEKLNRLREKYRRNAMILGAANAFSNGAIQIFHSISFHYGTYLILQKNVLPMDMYLALVTLSLISPMTGNAIAYLPEYKKALHSAGLIFELLRQPGGVPFDSKKGTLNISQGKVEVSNVSFHYHQRPDHVVLRDLCLDLQPGRTLALVGPSGSGKSTIISLLEKFYQVHAGSINIDNQNLEDINLHHLRSSLALVAQEPILFNCSIHENLVYGLTRNVGREEIEKALKIANASYFLSRFPMGLDTIVGDRGAQLSGGQKQRIAIARAILRNPKILLLDEATSALDSDSEKLVQIALDTASERLSTIVVAHRLSTIVHADSIAVLKEGEVVEQGSHEELLNLQGVYFDLIHKQEHHED